MAGPTWTTSHPLTRAAIEAPYAFEFFQLVNRIERAEPDLPQLGQQGPAAAEPIRLRPTLSLGFPPGDIDAAEWADSPVHESGHLLLSTTFLGLYGSDSPMPAHFTESLLPDTDDDRRVRGFLDLFHHRILSMIYRVWKKYRYYATFQGEGDDPISTMVRALLGIGTPAVDRGLKVPAVSLFRYCGALSQRPRSAAGLVGILRDHFTGVPFDLEACVGRWLAIDPGNQNMLGARNCALGVDLLVGERIFDHAGKFRLKIGPVGMEDYARFLPVGDAIAPLREMVGFYAGDPLAFDVEVTLRGDEVPETPLGERGVLGRLGWTSWAKSKACPDQAVVFQTQRQG
ncbi:MAG: type VI secretion system baseplate subunit TssG [Phycisphaerae bacterium]